jgi:hypothetical protein
MAVLINQPALAAALTDLCVRGSAHKQKGGPGTAAGSSSFSSSMEKVHNAAAPATFARTLLVALQCALTGSHPCDGTRMLSCPAAMRPGNSYAKQAQAAVWAAASGSEQQRQQLSRKMASMVSSCLKSFAASAVLQAERQQQDSKQAQRVQHFATAEHCAAHVTQPLEPAEGSYWPEIDAVAMAASLCCNLGTLLTKQTPVQLAGSNSSSHGSTSRVTSAAGPGREWMVLSAKCMLHLSTWLQQQPSTAITAAAFSTFADTVEKASPVGGFCHMALMLEHGYGERVICQLKSIMHTSSLVLVLHSAVRTVRWLGQQLLAASNLGDSSTVNEAATSFVLHVLADKADAMARTLKLATEALQLFVCMHASSRAAEIGDLVGMQQQLQDCWQQLQGLATSVLDECPVLSCCGNPSCLNMATLSEWQLVGGKRCVCDGCGVARYCSRACQVKMWHRHHRQVCMRLRQAPQCWLQLDRIVARLFCEGDQITCSPFFMFSGMHHTG